MLSSQESNNTSQRAFLGGSHEASIIMIDVEDSSQFVKNCHHRCNKSSKHQFNLTSRLTLFWPIVFLLVSSREQRHDQSRG
ncbi:hypothetical protein, partial [Endozoicomonas atrinae]|uniref:hypothetical protein n=1 Tax=Endozoicomonas atrinae TaxID=1333660 RepID=UPI001EE75520